MTQTQEINLEAKKEPKSRSFSNISTLKPDPVVLTLETPSFSLKVYSFS
jgi:hypothetical protein